jgi:hypothetical protein
MAVDLKSTTLLRRISLLLDLDCLIRLEHGRSRDRVRKLMFDRVEYVQVWRNVPVVRLILSAVLLGVPALLLPLLAETVGLVTAIALLVILAAIWTFYFYCGNTTIRIVRSGKPEDIKGIFRPGKVRRLIERMEANIRATQATGFENLQALIKLRESSQTPPSPPLPPAAPEAPVAPPGYETQP